MSPETIKENTFESATNNPSTKNVSPIMNSRIDQINSMSVSPSEMGLNE